MYRALTQNIEVTVEPYYLVEQSDPEDDRYVWGYRICIINHCGEAVRLVNRYWNITDERGQVDEVYGPGVVGKRPIIAPGESFEYDSGCPLETPSGVMFGSYEMESLSGRRFMVSIPAFSLDYPGLDRTLN